MNDKKIQPAALIITGVALVLLVIGLVWSSRHERPFVPTPPPASGATGAAVTPATQPSSVCYALNGADTASLQLTTSDGHTATGQLSVALAGKDASSGTLTGTLTSNGDNTGAIFDGQYANSQEGMTATNEQLIQLSPTDAKVGYGDMVPNGTGGYNYKDKHAVTYTLSIPRVDCQ